MAWDGTYKIWNTSTMLTVLREAEEVPSYWLSGFFPSVVTFDEEYIDLERIPHAPRKLAPLVMPMAQGKPIYSRGSRLSRIKPAYIKPSDPVTPNHVMRRRPGALISGNETPMQRYNATKADIIMQQDHAIRRRWEWLAARAIIDGKVTLEGPDYPAQVVDFERDPAHDVTLVGGARWGESGVSIVDSIQGWLDMAHQAEFGGAISRITVGTDAWAVMRKDPEIKDMMNNDYRGDNTMIARGLIETGEVRYVGQFDKGPEVYVYNDYYEADGSQVPFMDSRDVVLTGPGIMGVQCFGAIQDVRSQFQAMPIWSRNWLGENQSAEQIEHQSAPLMVPLKPNCSIRARVV